MKATKLLGMPVVSIASAENLGDVQDLVLNPDARHVVAIRIRLLPEGVVKTVSAVDARAGHDAVTIKDSRSVTQEELGEVEGTVDLSKLLGVRVLSHSGDFLGTIEEVELDTDLVITSYQVGRNALSHLFGGSKSLRAVEGIHFVKDILLVPDAADAEPELQKTT